MLCHCVVVCDVTDEVDFFVIFPIFRKKYVPSCTLIFCKTCIFHIFSVFFKIFWSIFMYFCMQFCFDVIPQIINIINCIFYITEIFFSKSISTRLSKYTITSGIAKILIFFRAFCVYFLLLYQKVHQL